eukprot:5881724-Amphidinium_carterae.1
MELVLTLFRHTEQCARCRHTEQCAIGAHHRARSNLCTASNLPNCLDSLDRHGGARGATVILSFGSTATQNTVASKAKIRKAEELNEC